MALADPGHVVTNLRVDPVVSNGPSTAVVGIVAFVLVCVVGYAAVRTVFPRSRGGKLKRLLAKRDEVTVLLHPNPDPDAMACALGIATLADAVGTTTHLQYPGQIRHQENRAFRTVLELDMTRVVSDDDLATEDVILVDHNEARGFNGARSVDPIAVIDHHPGDGTGQKFTDVRPDVGACASMVASYFQELNATVSDEDDDVDGLRLPSDVATGLLFGILRDTNNLTKGCSPQEFEASSYLYPGIDEGKLDRIANPQVPEEVLRLKFRALEEKEEEGSFAVCDLGQLDNVDVIPQAADELMHLEGLTAVVVFADNDGTIHLSGRSRDDRVHMGETIREVVSDIPMADGGGHARMAGAQLSVDHMEGLGPREGIDREQLKRRIFSAMNGEA